MCVPFLFLALSSVNLIGRAQPRNPGGQRKVFFLPAHTCAYGAVPGFKLALNKHVLNAIYRVFYNVLPFFSHRGLTF